LISKHLLTFLCWLSCLCFSAQAEVLTIRQATMQVTTAGQNTLKEKHDLPFRWDFNFPGENGRAQYTVSLPAYAGVASAEPYAVFIPRVGNQVRVYLNDQLIDAASDLDDSWQDTSKQPYWLALPTVLLLTDRSNVLRLDTTVQALRWGGLSEIYYGPAKELRSQYVMSYWWQQSSYIVIFVALFLMGMISWALWLSQREGLYGLFALSAMWGGFSAINQLSTTSWLHWPLQGIVASVALAWHIVFMTRFTLGIVGRTTPWVRLTLLATALSIGIAFVLAEPIYWTIAVGFLFLPMVAALIYTAKAADQEQSRQARLLFTVSLVVALTAMRDLFLVHLPESGISQCTLLPHALFLYVIMMGWILVQRYIEQHALYHELNVTLENRVKEREQQLSHSFEQIQAQGEERARLVERQRIMSDIHDGVGGQLVGLVNMIKRGESNQSLFDQKQLSEHAQMALDELRVAVDAMQPVDGDLATVLATLRYRLEPRLKASDLALVWQIDELPVMTELTPQKVLQIQRILLEAFTNIIQHAKATTVTVSAKHVPELASIQITIDDDGIGFEPQELEAKGHGLRNMCFRAEAIGALITFQRLKPKGVTLTLTMPVI
jgi:signal transduction histidine kinase